MTTSNRFAKPVAAGETWLDDNHPDWLKAFADDRAAGLLA